MPVSAMPLKLQIAYQGWNGPSWEAQNATKGHAAAAPALKPPPAPPTPPTPSRKVTFLAPPDQWTAENAYFDPEVTHSELNNRWVEVDRPGGTPILVYGGKQLRQMQMKIILDAWNPATRSYFGSIDGQLKNLRYMMCVRPPLTIAYGSLEGGMYDVGLWRCTGMTIESQLRAPGTFDTVRAEINLTFTQASEPPKPAPVVPTPPPPPPAPPSPAPPAPRIHVIKKGDTMWDMAKHYYGNPLRWPEIAKANGNPNPRLLQIGSRFVIP